MGHVLIVGAGPAGASLASVLADRGVKVTLLERQRDFSREFRGEVLVPSGIDALEQMGLGAALGGVPSFVVETFEGFMNGERLGGGDVDPSVLGGFTPRALSQPALLEAIVAEASKRPSFRFARGASVKELLRDGDRIVGVRARTEEGDEEFRADLVIGADGRASVVRKHGGFRVASNGAPMDVVWCKVPCPDSWRGVRAYMGRGHLLIAYRTWDHNLQMGWVILKGRFGELRSRGVEAWIDEMALHVDDEFAAHLRAHANAVERPFLLDVASDRVARWWRPGSLLIGDAAHTMSPVGGQGINLALRDAIVAANHLVPVLCSAAPDAAALDAALAAIEEERLPEIVRIQHLQALPPRFMLSRAWWGEPLRRVASIFMRRPAAPARAFVVARPFLFGVTEVKLAV